MAERSSIVIWCRPTPGATPTRSFSTTYHLNFVRVPVTYQVEKREGEATAIDLEMRAGDVIVANVK
jgi:hypothetical protein